MRVAIYAGENLLTERQIEVPLVPGDILDPTVWGSNPPAKFATVKSRRWHSKTITSGGAVEDYLIVDVALTP